MPCASDSEDKRYDQHAFARLREHNRRSMCVHMIRPMVLVSRGPQCMASSRLRIQPDSLAVMKLELEPAMVSESVLGLELVLVSVLVPSTPVLMSFLVPALVLLSLLFLVVPHRPRRLSVLGLPWRVSSKVCEKRARALNL